MALVAVQRSPSNSNSSSTISASDNDEDEPDLIMKRVCECFFAIKGAALILPHSTDPRPIKKHPVVGELQQHLQSIFFLLRTQDTITLAVRLESIYSSHIRYMVLVSTLGVNDTEETIILGVDIRNTQCTVGLVLPIWRDTDISMDGDGGFGVHTSSRAYIFKPVSIQAMWSAIQCLNKTCQIARNRNYIPAGLNLTWAGYYSSLKLSTPKCVYEWNLLPETDSHIQDHMTYHEGFVEGGHYCPSERELTERYIWVKLREIMMHVDLDNVTGKQLRLQLEDEMGRDLKEYKSAIDKQAMTILGQMDSASKILDFLYLGSEWNASNYDEMNKLGIRYVLNVSLEIDNFFPLHFTYHNVRVHDDLQADLLRHWDETYRYLSKAKETGTKALVHCKMGMSRSAATVTAFVMKEMGWSLEKAFSYVKEKRSIAQPNPNFMAQLHEYQGILDASKQRHNALWRSKSESDLSTCGSMENICDPPLEVFSSSDDLTASLRRRSWSPEDNVADALIDFPEHTETSYVGEIYLRNPSPTGQRSRLADQEKDTSSDDACSEIHIPVPTLPLSPRAMDTAPVHSPRAAGTSVAQNPCEGKNLDASKGVDEGRGLATDVVESEGSPPRAEGKEMEAEENIGESDDPLNTNNNSATCLERLQDREGGVEGGDEQEGEEETIPVDVKERISTIESQISRLDSSSSSPEKAKPESPLLDELPADTVRRTRQKLEQRMKGDLVDATESEDESGFLADSEMELEVEMEIEVVCEGGEEDPLTQVGDNQRTEKEMDTSEVVHQAESLDRLGPCPVHVKADVREESHQRQGQSCLGPVPSQYFSPSLAKLEPGTVLKSREKFQAWQIKGWKSPNYDEDSMAKFGSVRIDPRDAECPQSPPGERVHPEEPKNSRWSGGGQDPSDNATVAADRVSETLENVDCTVSPVHVDPSERVCERHIPADVIINEDNSILVGGSVESGSDTENFIVIPTGEEIPLQPGTVRKQREGFEQLSSLDRPKEALNTGVHRTQSDDGCIPTDETGASGAMNGAQNVDHRVGEMSVEFTEPCLKIEESGDCLIREKSGRILEEESREGGYEASTPAVIGDNITTQESEVGHISITGDEVTTSGDKRSGFDTAHTEDTVALPELTVGDGVTAEVEEEGCTVSLEEGGCGGGGSGEEGGWRTGDVKKHTQQLEKLASAVSVSVPKKPATSPRALGNSGIGLSSERLQEIRDLGRMILAKDDDDDSWAAKDPRDSEGARPSSFPSSTGMFPDDADGQDFVRVVERIRSIELKRCATIASMSSEKVSRKYRKHWPRYGSNGGSPEKGSSSSQAKGTSPPTLVSQEAATESVPVSEETKSAKLGGIGGSPPSHGSKVIPQPVVGQGGPSPAPGMEGTNMSAVSPKVAADSSSESDATEDIRLGGEIPPASVSKVNTAGAKGAVEVAAKSRANTHPSGTRTDTLRTEEIRGQECPRHSEGNIERTGGATGGGIPRQSTHSTTVGRNSTSKQISPPSDFVRVVERIRYIELKRCATIASMSSEKVSQKYRKHWTRYGSNGGSPEKESSTSHAKGKSPPTPVSHEAVTESVSVSEEMKTAEMGWTKEVPEHVEGRTPGMGEANPSTPALLQVTADSSSKSDTVEDIKLRGGIPPASVSNVNAAGPREAVEVAAKSRANTHPSGTRIDSLRTEERRGQECPRHSEENIERTGGAMGGGIPKQSTHSTTVGRNTSSKRISPPSGQIPHSTREKKPYGPTHPLARLRQLSGKHPFYSTM